MTTPVFHHRDTGRSEADWLASPGWQQVRPIRLGAGVGTRGLVVLAAHPDDETLGAGGAIALAHAAGIPVQVLVATDGEASHPQSPTHSPQELAALRQAEVGHALSLLAPGCEVRHLRLPDGQLADHERELQDALGRWVAELDVGCVLLAPWREDGHPDHAAAGRVAARVAQEYAAALGEYPIWAWHWARDEDVPWSQLRSLPLDDATLLIKQAALAEHHTQVSPLSSQPGDETLLGPEMLEHFDRPFECFIDVDGRWDESIFERLHAAAVDPWSVRSSAYERRKREQTLDALPAGRFERAFEPGCSIGELTAALADRCDELLAVDLSATAVRAARARTAALPTVSIEQHAVPDWWPAGDFDLIALSEICYFLDVQGLRQLLLETRSSLRSGGHVLLCDWRHPIDGWALDADRVHRAAHEILRLPTHFTLSTDDMVLEVLGPAPGEGGAV